MENFKEFLDNGIYAINDGNYANAIDYINKSLELKNDWEIPYFYRGVAHHALSKFDDAIFDYTKALQLNDKMVDAYYNRAKITLTRKDLKNPDINLAIKDLEKAIDLDDKFLDALYAIACAHKKLGNYHISLDYLNKVIELEPEAINARALKKLLLQKYI